MRRRRSAIASAIIVHDDRMRRLFADVEVVPIQSGFGFLEGPVWVAAGSELGFSDIPGDCLYRRIPG